MTSVAVNNFGGVIPRVGARLLPDSGAQIANNVKMFSGELRSWRRGRSVVSPSISGSIQSIYRIYSGLTDYWLAWAADVNVVRAPTVNSEFRLFYSGDTTPRKTNLALATSGPNYPQDYREMGIPAPPAFTAAIGVVGVAPNSTRTYVSTYVTDWGEEGPPSLPSNALTFGATGFTINLSGLEQGKRSVTLSRVSQTATGVSAAHGFSTGQVVTIAGAVEVEYNGNFAITVVDANTFTYTVTGAPATPATGTITAQGKYGITKRRIYRSLTGTTGNTNYQLVAETDLSLATYSDLILDSALGGIIQSTTIGVDGSDWVGPPSDLKGIVMHPNGFAVGFSGKVLVMTPPFQVHAWPLQYRRTLDYDIVGIGIYGSTIVVGTKGTPYRVTGNAPGAMSSERIEIEEPCVSKRGMAAFSFGVAYPTPNGLELIGVGGAVNSIEPWMKRDEWQTFAPTTLIAGVYQDTYFGFYQASSGGAGFIFDRQNKNGPLVNLAFNVTAVYTDPETSKLYYVQNGTINEWDADPVNNSAYEWKSKMFVLPKPVNFAIAQVDGNYGALTADIAAVAAQRIADAAYNSALSATDAMAGIVARANVTAYTVGKTVKDGPYQLACTVAGTSDVAPPSYAGKVLGDAITDGTVTWKLVWQVESVTHGGLNEYETDEFTLNGSLLRDTLYVNFDSRSLLFQLYANGTLRYTKNLTSRDPFRLPGGYEEDNVEFKLSGNIDAYYIKVAETLAELRQI